MKEFFYGIISTVIFFYVTTYIEITIGQHIFVGDPVTVSYHRFTYSGLIVLCGMIITLFCILNSKLNEIKSMLSDMKKEPIELDTNKEE